jgi:MacB-like periplasmic core domain/FtsX-like permease family
MVAAIGARRTDTAYPRLLRATLAEDTHVNVGGYSDKDPAFIGKLRRLPQVADLGLRSIALLVPDMPGAPPAYSGLSRFAGLMNVDEHSGRTVDRPLILAGRQPHPGRVEEVGLSESLARRWRVRPGGTIRLRALAPDQLFSAMMGERLTPGGPALTLTVVAIQRLPEDLDTDPEATEGIVSLTPAFYRTYKDRIACFPPEPYVRLQGGQADLAGFAAATRRLARNSAEVSTETPADRATRVGQAIRVEAVALLLFAVLATLAALVLVGQTFSRELFLAREGNETLRALGMSRPQRFAAAMAPVALVGAVGGLVGAGLAVLASPLTPMGLARQAEPSPGFTVHLAGLGIGVAATLALTGARAAVPAWQFARAPQDASVTAGRSGGSSALTNAAARSGLPPSAVAGLRMALEQGRGPTAVPVRPTLVGVTAGIVAVAATLAFTASLYRLLGTPRLYGWNLDAVAGDWALDDPASRRPAWLANNPRVGAFSAVHFHTVLVDGAEVTAAGVDTAHSHVFPTIVEGREPSGPDEIALGTRTMRQLGRRLGQTVHVGARRSATMRIVGRAAVLTGDADTAGTGAILTLGGLQQLDPDPRSGYGVFYVRFAPGADPQAAVRSLRQPRPRVEQEVQLPEPTTDVANMGRVGDLPNVLAGLLALLATLTLTHLLITSVRRRRRDLAILKTLGFARRQVAATVAWQATTVAAVALVVGVPLGLAVGRWAWSLLIERIGLGAEPVTPHLALLAGMLGTILVANLVAAWPGWVAARTRPAVTLRAE